MSDLLAAAKAALDCWDRHWPIESRMKRLKSAVERAEEQESVGFEEWFEPNYKMLAELWTGECAQVAWIAAQQAERERIKQIISESSYCWDYLVSKDRLLEQIDGLDGI